jgi:hypothetical protein
MNPYPSFTNVRSAAADKFLALRLQAVRISFWAKLTGRNSRLAAFPEHAQCNHPNRKLIGVKEIRVDQIIGTLNRERDFDHKFRPLGKHLLERWVSIFADLDPDSWEPILVHKIGEQYYVEDGHHRVSVARNNGRSYIQAKIWDYPLRPQKAVMCQPSPCPEPRAVKAAQRAAG